jgi:hypothetical protein
VEQLAWLFASDGWGQPSAMSHHDLKCGVAWHLYLPLNTQYGCWQVWAMKVRLKMARLREDSHTK